uniref:Uncharacterized protein n=1 Tax=Trichuris muris TaxID=70415 RepID=A0A5S6QC54_TRIMR
MTSTRMHIVRNDEKTEVATASSISRRLKSPKRTGDWIDDVITRPELRATTQQAHCQAAPLQQLPPTVTIEPFERDPNAQRITILRQLLTRRLRATIGPSLYGPNPILYDQTLADLRRLFGDPNLVIDAYVKNVGNNLCDLDDQPVFATLTNVFKKSSPYRVTFNVTCANFLNAKPGGPDQRSLII